MKIHKAGAGTLTIIFLVLFTINFLAIYFTHAGSILNNVIMWPSVVVMVIALQFFRNPKRRIVESEFVFLSPADGTVVVVEPTAENEYFKDKRLQVSIFMSLWNVHINRYPVTGPITYFRHHQGKYLVARHPKSSEENERTSIVIKHQNGTEILFRQIAGYVARRIIAPLTEGEQAHQGKEFGFIKFGSRVDIFFPLDTKLRVQMGDKVQAGISVIADMKKASETGNA